MLTRQSFRIAVPSPVKIQFLTLFQLILVLRSFRDSVNGIFVNAIRSISFYAFANCSVKLLCFLKLILNKSLCMEICFKYVLSAMNYCFIPTFTAFVVILIHQRVSNRQILHALSPYSL